MQYRLLVLDIDGTLRPAGQPRVPKETADAVCAVQKYGVKVAIATGRGRAEVPRGMLRGIRPDYWLCAAGSEVLDAAGREVYSCRMTPEEMYALVDFCEDRELPLGFTYPDGGYVYLEYERMHQHELANGLEACLRDGEDQDRHLLDLPFSAFARFPRPAVADFQEKYGYLGLRFLFFSDDGCDVLRAGQDKAAGLTALLEHTGLTAADCAAVGDSNNDVELLRMAGLSFCMQDGADTALAAAARRCPTASACGVAAVCRELWPEAFAHA